MGLRRLTGSLAAGVVLLPGAAAQEDIDAGESLVGFVETVLGFPADSVPEVILYLVVPTGILYFILHYVFSYFADWAEQRLESRSDYYDSDDDLPPSMKLGALLISFLTVTSIGRADFTGGIGSGLLTPLLVLAGLTGLLAALYYLMTTTVTVPGGQGGQDDGNGGDSDGGNGNGGGGGGNDDEDRPLGSEPFSYFDTGNFIDELEALKQELEGSGGSPGLINQLEKARADLENVPSADPDNYSELKDLIGRTIENLKNYRKYMRLDKAYTQSPPASFDGSQLEQSFKQDLKDNRDPHSLVKELNERLEALVNNDDHPHDVFEKISQDLELLLKGGHFIHHYPRYERLALDPEEAKLCIQKAEDLNHHPGWSQSEKTRLQSICDQGFKNEVETCVTEAEKLAKKELKLSDLQINILNLLIEKEKNSWNVIENLGQDIENNYEDNGIKYFLLQNLEKTEELIEDELKGNANRLKAQLGDDKDYEASIYKNIKELEEKI